TARLFLNRIAVSEADPALCEREPERVVRHEVDQLLDLVALGGADKRVADLRLDIYPQDRAAVAQLPERPIVLHLAPRWFRDGSTLASTLELARRLRTLPAPLVLTANAEVKEAVSAFESIGADAVLQDLPFFHWAAVFERAACVVTVDTGATHVASAVRRPTLVAFEHRFFRLASQEWAPYRVPHRCAQKPESESPTALALFRDEVVQGVTELLDA
ncbi:MAG TPA: glycosyltransferase family 9 protein, partial [Candidatus Baltobacteraceae bacterium]|nr:glycosyltransferase family 9 protein [Candidatus Baltobacteraceae bacterium]